MLVLFCCRAAPVRSGDFAYGLPGNFNALGGGELNWDPAGFLEGKSELEVNRYREVCAPLAPPTPTTAH